MNAKRAFAITFLFTALMAGKPVFAFQSGSDGSDGAFAPTADTSLTMNESGIFNFTTVDIPAGVTVTLDKNAGNTPLVILASGDVNILGTLSVDGGDGAALGETPVPGDGAPGIGGPGGADGGRGGIYRSTGNPTGAEGRGPGAGHPGTVSSQGFECGGGGGGHAGSGANGGGAESGHCGSAGARGGGTYGTAELSQLLGGSGGAGGSGGFNIFGSGGGGGGGALLIASSGTVNVEGAITAIGGRAGVRAGTNRSGAGGGGSGGAIRIVATRITGEGIIDALGAGAVGVPLCGVCQGGNGGEGRIRLEAESLERVAFTTPNYTFSAPRPVFLSGFPTLRITSVGGIATPTVPTGDRDVVLPGFTSNPVSVDLATTGVPPGTTIQVLAKPTRGYQTSATSTGVVGSEANGTASADIDLPNGASVLTAQTTFTVTASLGNALKNFAEGERVKSVELAAAPGQGSIMTLITVSGKRYTLPSNAAALN